MTTTNVYSISKFGKIIKLIFLVLGSPKRESNISYSSQNDQFNSSSVKKLKSNKSKNLRNVKEDDEYFEMSPSNSK